MGILISVVITAYKRPDRLQKALQTVVSQTHKNLEILVLDGSNLEENKSICKKFEDKRIRYIGIKQDKGIQRRSFRFRGKGIGGVH